jgi:phosphatidylinositol 4-kinase
MTKLPVECFQDQTSLQIVEEFASKITNRMIRYSYLGNGEEVGKVFDWTRSYINNLEKDSDRNVYYIASLQGVFKGFLEVNTTLLEREGELLHEMVRLFSENITLVDTEQENPSFNLFTITCSFFNMIRHVLAGMVTLSPMETCTRIENVWDDLLLIQAPVRKCHDSFVRTLELIQAVVWQSNLRDVIISKERDADMADLLVFSTQSSILASLLLGNSSDDLIDSLISIMDDSPLIPEFALDLYLTCMEGLGIIGVNDPLAISRVVSYATSLLLDPHFVFGLLDDVKRNILRECSAQILSISLDGLAKQSISSSLKKATLFQCINSMHSSYQKMFQKQDFDENKRIYENSACAISHLSRILKPKDTIEVAIPALVRRLEESTSDFNEPIWLALGNIGMTNDVEIFKAIISFTLNNTQSMKTVYNIPQTLAKMPGRPVGLLEYYLERALALFMEKAASYHKTARPQDLQDMYDWVCLIRVVCDHEDFAAVLVGGQNPEIVHQMRNMWFCLVLFVFQNGSWPKEWVGILRVIARRTPPLILEKNERNLEVNLGSTSILLASFPESVTTRLTNTLLGLLPNLQYEIRALSWPVCVYLTTIYQLELLRMKSFSLDFVCTYLVDDRLQNPQIYVVMEAIADLIFKQATKESYYRKMPESVMEDHLRMLLLYAAHRNAKIRRFCSRWVKRIISTAQHMLFCRSTVYFMLNVLLFLDSGIMNFKESSIDLSMLTFSNRSEARSSAVEFQGVCADWLGSALKISRTEGLPVLEGYVFDLNSTHPWITASQIDQVSIQEGSLMMALFQRVFSDPLSSAPLIRYSNARARYLGQIHGMIFALQQIHPELSQAEVIEQLSRKCSKDLRKIFKDPDSPHFVSQLYQALSKAGSLIIESERIESDLIQLVCHAPSIQFTVNCVEQTMEILAWIMAVKPQLVPRVLGQLTQVWELVASQKVGMYSCQDNSINPFEGSMTYGAPPKMPDESFTCQPHKIWINLYVERFKFDRLLDADAIARYTNFILTACHPTFKLSTHFKAFQARLDLVSLGIRIGKELVKRNDQAAVIVWTSIFRICTDLFSNIPLYGDIDRKDFMNLLAFYQSFKSLQFDKIATMTSNNILKSAFIPGPDGERVEFSDVQQLVVLLLEYKINRFATWINPLGLPEELVIPPPINERAIKWSQIVKIAWRVNPLVAIHLRSRFPTSADQIDFELSEISRFSEIKTVHCAAAVNSYLKTAWKQKSEPQMRHLMYWKPIPPITAIQILCQPTKPHPWILQYCIRSLEDFPINLVFFYIPQLVQALRHDYLGYIEKFILEAAKTSQFFAHQIIWNMEANMYKDDNASIPDSIKPTLDRVISKIIQALTGPDKEFYEREFSFFKEITDISGKLKPLVQSGASKADKKKKIDEELRKIKVDVGVYLPTNPDRTVVDIDYDSGRPLQSHAKAPYMATFKVEDPNSNAPAVWMSSIFKVGDDCRQDVLALQLISVFTSIFQSAGLDLYTFPYRVVATATGCGVIEVIPQSISRDMMGREKVNSLYDWFVANFGPDETMAYKNARNEFVKSLAAYSVIMFLLQIKDRHNGNIMFDKQGHLIHIDFGFMLSIAPGGGLLEVSPFKLTSEMIQVMGGDASAPAYVEFSELCIKAYLATRLHAEEIISIVNLMMESGLPCFKGMHM